MLNANATGAKILRLLLPDLRVLGEMANGSEVELVREVAGSFAPVLFLVLIVCHGVEVVHEFLVRAIQHRQQRAAEAALVVQWLECGDGATEYEEEYLDTLDVC